MAWGHRPSPRFGFGEHQTLRGIEDLTSDMAMPARGGTIGKALGHDRQRPRNVLIVGGARGSHERRSRKFGPIDAYYVLTSISGQS